MSEPLHRKGDRVVVDQPMVAGKPYSWHGKHGVVTRVPGEPANPHITSEPSPGYSVELDGSYAVQFDGSPHSAAPFSDAAQDPRYHSLIVAEVTDA